MAEEVISSIHLTDDRRWELCRRVEECYGTRVKTPKQFEALSDSVFSRTGVVMSATTLKRLWGYLDERVEPRRSTLDTLAVYCGWRDWDAFCRGEVPEIESGFVAGKHIDVRSQLKCGDCVKLMWVPGRVCLVRYKGDMLFEVEDSEGTRLTHGDTFRCALIVSGEPLYLDDYRHEGMRAGVYVCGRRSGVTFMRVEAEGDQV